MSLDAGLNWLKLGSIDDAGLLIRQVPDQDVSGTKRCSIDLERMYGSKGGSVARGRKLGGKGGLGWQGPNSLFEGGPSRNGAGEQFDSSVCLVVLCVWPVLAGLQLGTASVRISRPSSLGFPWDQAAHVGPRARVASQVRTYSRMCEHHATSRPREPVSHVLVIMLPWTNLSSPRPLGAQDLARPATVHEALHLAPFPKTFIPSS